MLWAARITIVSAVKKYTMTFDSSEDDKDGTTTWTVSTAPGPSREEPRELSFTFSTDEYTSQEKQLASRNRLVSLYDEQRSG